MRILVIGGTRFIGQAAVRALADAGHDITIFHRGQTEPDLPASVKHIHCGDASPAFIGWKVQFLPQYVDEFRRLAPDVVLDARKPDRRQCYIIGGNNALKIWQVSSKRGKDTMRSKHYSMIIQWSEEDRVYIVTVPELPGCKTHGKTYKKAVKQGEDAIESWIMAAKDRGHPIPAPRILTAISID